MKRRVDDGLYHREHEREALMGFWETSIKGVPMLGTIINGAQGLAHMGMAGIDALMGDSENAEDHVAMGAIDLIKAIPWLGTAVGASELVYNMNAGNPTEEALTPENDGPDVEQTLLQDVRRIFFGERSDGKVTGRDTEGLF
ncbi:MAG: hypothetical protein ACKV2T_10565 [Kofleriaceae bacterium]